METKTQTHDIGQALHAAVLQAAMPADTVDASSGQANANDSQDAKKAKKEERGRAASPRSGAVLPQGKGRPPGVRNKLTNLRDAVLEAFETVGGPAYLVQLAQGTQSDRAAFVGLVSKVLPTQVQAQVDGAVQIQLSWLGGRSIGTTAAQSADQAPQVVDLQRDANGAYRIIDPVTQPAPAQPGPENPDPPPPIDRQAGVE